MSKLCQCVQERWGLEHGEETVLVQSWVNSGGSRCEGEEASVKVSLKEVKEWQQEIGKTLKEGGEWVVGINVAPFSIEETALMVLVAGYESWTYVPIDVQLPVNRQLELLQTAGVQRLVTSVESPLGKLFASDVEGDTRVNSRVIDLKTSSFQPVQVVDFPDKYFQSTESECRCVKARTGDVAAPLYVLFTSGTTGNPKGVMGTRAGAWARLEWMWTTYPFVKSESRERVLRATKLSFVDSVWEILGAILKRVPLVHLQVPRKHCESNDSELSLTRSVVLDDSARFLGVMREERVTRFTAVPSVLEVLVLHLSKDDYESGMAYLRYVLSSGETLSLHVLQQLSTTLPDVTILNLYGTTEVSGDVTCVELKAPLSPVQVARWQQHGVPIGKLDQRGVVGGETSLVLLSDSFEKNALPFDDIAVWPRRKPTGSIEMGTRRGVLYVSGPSLALGHIGSGSEDSFVSSDALFRNQDGDGVERSKKWFCTGDICSVLEGHLYFCGRKDNAVKIHGQRVYLEAVERAVAAAVAEIEKDARLQGSHQVVAFTTTKEVSKFALRQRYIVACVICEEADASLGSLYTKTNALNAWIAEHYGASHIPQEVLLVSEKTVPRLAHGKIDRRALEQLCSRDDSVKDVPISMPRCSDKSNTEKLLARLLNEILDIPMADGVSEDLRTRTFRDVGGNSLLATLFVHQIKEELGGCPFRGQELLEMTIGEMLSILNSRPGKHGARPKLDTHVSVEPDGALILAGEPKRQKMAHHAQTGVQRGGANQQEKLSFVSRYNQSSMNINGVYIPTCYGSSVSPTGSTSSSWGLKSAWQVDLGKCIDASPLVVQRRNSTWAIVGSHSAQLICVDVQAGRAIWRVTLDDRIEACAALSVRHELVYVGTYAGTLFALDVQSGRTKWRFQAQGTVKSSALVVDEHQLVVFGAYDHKLYGLDTALGHQRWVVDLQGSVFSTPFYCPSSKQLFAASTSGIVVALKSALSGDFSGVVEQWKLQLPAPVFAGVNVDFASEMLVVGCADGLLYGVEMSSGVVRWQVATEKPIFSSPCVYRSGSVVFGSHDGMLRRVNTQSGELVWATNLHGAIFASPAVVRLGNWGNRSGRGEEEENLLCCVATTTGRLYFCDEKTGSVVYQTADSTGKAVQGADPSGDLGPLFGSPVLIDKWCLLGTRTNILFGFELTATKNS